MKREVTNYLDYTTLQVCYKILIYWVIGEYGNELVESVSLRRCGSYDVKYAVKELIRF